MKKEHHAEYSSQCMSLGCSFCRLNRNWNERLQTFIQRAIRRPEETILTHDIINSNHYRVKIKKTMETYEKRITKEIRSTKLD